MKKNAMLLLFTFMLTTTAFSQNLKYEIKVKYNHDTPEITADITVFAKSGDPGFTYFLMTNDPIKGEILFQSGTTGKRKYVFTGIKPGKYFIKIEDGKGKQAGKTVNVIENEN